MWERRYGFPIAARTEHGHRRYVDAQVEQVRRVAAARAAGVPLAIAVARVLEPDPPAALSIFATIRRRQPELEVLRLSKPTMLAVSHGIEDEVLARAERGVIFGCFQREHFYRQAQDRWRQLAQGAAVAAVFANFASARGPGSLPAEVPITPNQPLAREWALLYYSERTAICLAGREPPSSSVAADGTDRLFEAVWSVDPAVCSEIATACTAVAASVRSAVGERAATILASPPASSAAEQLLLASAVFSRALVAIG